MSHSKIQNFNDNNGNIVESEKVFDQTCEVIFRGNNNLLRVSSDAKLKSITVIFECDNGYCEIGANSFKGKIKLGEDCSVSIKDGVTCTDRCFITVSEGASINIGEDCMFASKNEIRAQDAHPVFDSLTGARINPSRSISIGDHVWLAEKVAVLSGAVIGSGSVIGYAGVVKGKIPNNCIAAGVPAKIIRRNIAWERPNLNANRDKFRDGKVTHRTTQYWKPTVEVNQIERSRVRSFFRYFIQWFKYER